MTVSSQVSEIMQRGQRGPDPVIVKSVAYQQRMRHAQQEILLEFTPVLTLGIGILFAVYALIHLLNDKPSLHWPVFVSEFTIAISLLGVRVWRMRRELPSQWIYPLAAFLSAMTLFNSLLHLGYYRNPQETMNLAVLMIGLGFVFLDYRWFLPLMLGAYCGWQIIYRVSGLAATSTYSFSIISGAALLALFAHIVRVKTFQRMQWLHYQGELRQQELEKALQAAQRSETRYRSVIENSLAAISLHDLQGNIFMANQVLAESLGYLPEELIGRNMRDLMMPEVRSLMPASMKQLEEKGAGGGLVRACSRTGEEQIWDYRHILQKNDDGSTYVLGIGLDITRRWQAEAALRKAHAELEQRVAERTTELSSAITELRQQIAERAQAEAAQRESETRLRALVSSLDDVVFEMTPQGDCLNVWAGSAGQLVRPTGELIGQNLREYLSEEQAAKFLDVFAHVTACGQSENFEYEIELPKGRRWYLARVSPVQGEGETTQALCLLARDITDRKLSELELQSFAMRLSRSNSELQDFANIASHDLQEPLRKVQTFGDRLKTKFGATLGEDGNDYLNRMLSATGRMQKFIDDLLTYSRVTTKASPFTSVSLEQIVGEVLSDLEVRIEQTQGQISVATPGTIEADPLQMRQLLQNLIGNALKFHQPGRPPIIRIESRFLPCPQEHRSSGGLSNNFLELRVTDNGIGFDEKYLDRIFAIFQRLHGRDQYEGTGIGLAVCRKIVERHNGTITATSQPGQGTTFIVSLPARQVLSSLGDVAEQKATAG